jgi:hypothetical protein
MGESACHRFTISIGAAGEIELLTTARLPFEPTGTLRAMRDDLRDALRHQSAGNDEVLYGTYASAESGVFDVEGTCCCTTSARRASRMRHATAFDSNASPGNSLAEWSLIPGAGRLTATDVWLATKRGALAVTHTASPASRFGLRIRLTAPRSLNAVAVVKGIVDGALCALHVHDGTAIDEVAERLSISLGIPQEEITRLLLDRSKACLGERRLLWPWRSSIQWNPADDLIVAGELVLDRGNWGLKGSLFEVR